MEADTRYFHNVMPFIANVFKMIYRSAGAAASQAGSVSTDKISFSAKDLLARLVRANAAIRGNPTSSAEPMWFHNAGCLDIAVESADVHELLQAGLIEYQSESCQSGQNLYRASPEGKKMAGREAVADAAKSAAVY